MNMLLDLLTDEALSNGVVTTKEYIKNLAKETELNKNLVDYDQRFIQEHESEIDQYKTNVDDIKKNRKSLISIAKDCLKQGNAIDRSNSKDEFIALACRKINDDSIVAKSYLAAFYDLVKYNVFKDIPDEQKALKTYLIDLILDKDNVNSEKYNELNRKIDSLFGRIEKMEEIKTEPVDFESYYQIVEQRFTTGKKGVYKELVGGASDEKSYIEPFITDGSKQIAVLSFLDSWFSGTKSGVILFHGEPGHGKTLLCDKVIFEFRKNGFLNNKAKNVMAVSLNTGNNRNIINGKEVELENALTWNTGKKHKFSFGDCRGALLFMDGFDEFIDEAISADTDIGSIYDFMACVDEIATNNDIHIVVLSRTIAVSNNLKSLDGVYKYYKLSSLTNKQQVNWLNQHKEYSDYIETYNAFQCDKNMCELLGIPLLFRMIVHNRYNTTSDNVVELYNNLFIHILKNRRVTDNDELQSIEQGLMNLAYMIYCTDTYSTILNREKWDTRWIFAFYTKSTEGRKIGFFHRTFYQYFLAKYIYAGIISVTDKNAEEFIGSFAERELDGTTREYLTLFYDEDDESAVNANLAIMIKALCKTEAYLNHDPLVKTGTAERSKILRSQNIYRNILHIATALSYVIQIPFKNNLDVMIRAFRSDGIKFSFHFENNKPDLKGAYLDGADLSSVYLDDADLRESNLKHANLTRIHLNRAKLSEAKMSYAILIFAKMNEAILNGAMLDAADLTGASLERAKMRESDLSGAIMIGAKLDNADLSNAIFNYLEPSIYEGHFRKPVVLQHASLKETILSNAKLHGADLTKAILDRADLNGADLRGANLTGAHLIGAKLVGANLTGANLTGAHLEGATLIEADLSGAILTGATLREADLTGAELIENRKELTDLKRMEMNNPNPTEEELLLFQFMKIGLKDEADQIRDIFKVANLSRAKIDIKYKELIDSSTLGFDSIEWISIENT